MPLIGINTYTIDFDILESNNPKKLVLLDQSNYLTYPKKPLLDVYLPGFTGYVEIPYTPNTIITLDSDSLQLTEECDYDNKADLPDGIYQIVMKVCPYDELFKKQCYLKTTQFECQFEKLLLDLDTSYYCIDVTKLKEAIIDLEILIKSAKAEVRRCNLNKGLDKYKAAVKKLNTLNKKLNCK